MKNLELATRKNTTENAKKQVVDFIKSFNFYEYSDVSYVESTSFNLCFDATGNNDYHNTAYFTINEGRFEIRTYDSAIGDYEETCKKWSDSETVFDRTCTFISFKQLQSAMEDFIAKINKKVEEKEGEIADFLTYVAGCESYQETIKNAVELENKEEIL